MDVRLFFSFNRCFVYQHFVLIFRDIRSRSPNLANKNSCQLKHSTFIKELCFFAAQDLPGFAWERSCLQTLSWFLAAVCRLRPLLLNLYGLFATLIHYTASAVPHFLPTAGSNQKSMLNTSIAYTFLLPCGGSATCDNRRHWHKSYTIAMLSQPQTIAGKPCIASHVVVNLCCFASFTGLPPPVVWRRCGA